MNFQLDGMPGIVVAAAIASDDTIVYPDSWAHRGPANVNDPGYGWDVDGKPTFEIIGNHADPAACTLFYKKTYTWTDGKLVNDSGWVKVPA